MAIEIIDLGTVPLDGSDGDVAREAFEKVNANFAEHESEIDALIPRVTTVENEVGQLEIQAGQIQGDLTNLTESFNILSSEVGANTTDIQNLENSREYTLVPGEGITIDRTDPTAPIISSTGSTGSVWGQITGDISNQADLSALLEDKASVSDLEIVEEKVDRILTGDAPDKGAGAVPYSEALEYPDGSLGAALGSGGASVSQLRQDLANQTDQNKNVALLGYFNRLSGDGRNLYEKLADNGVSFEDFGAMGDGRDDWQAIQDALDSGVPVYGRPGREYLVSRPLLQTVAGQKVRLNSSSIIAAPGFIGQNLFSIGAARVELSGPGVLDGRNLPPMPGDYIGTDFTGITLISTPGEKLGVSLSDLFIWSGQCAAMELQDCPGANVNRLSGDGSAMVIDKAANAVFSFNRCSRLLASNIRASASKWKAITFRNSANWTANNLFCDTSSKDQAALFLVGCSKFAVSDVATINGFGIKMDSCTDGTISDINVDANNNGLAGAYLQGCSKVQLTSGILRNFTGYGVGIGPHSSKANLSIDCSISELMIQRDGTIAGDLSSGVYLVGDSMNGLYDTVLRNVLIRGTDIGVRATDTATVLMNNVDVEGVRFKDIKSYLWTGPALSLRFVGNSVETSPTLVEGILFWTKNVGSTLIVDNNEFFGVGTTANMVNLIGNGTTFISLDQVSVSGNKLRNGMRLLKLDMQTTSNRVRLLSAVDNQTFGCASASVMDLNSASGTVTQVCITGNMFYGSDGTTRQSINFTPLATNGKFNGVSANNSALVINPPNNA